MGQQTHTNTSVVDVPERSRFELAVDGRLAGFAEYRLQPGRVVFTHTEIDDAHQGQGLAAVLASAALDTVQDRGLLITPRCPYIASYIRKHPDYLGSVDPQHREAVS
jgi:uncharacterized protein